MSVTYGYTVSWTDRDGRNMSVSIAGCETRDEAFVASFEAAKRLGYRRPRWWELTRWLGENDYEAQAIKAAGR